MKKHILIAHIRAQINDISNTNPSYVFQIRAYNIVIKKLHALDATEIDANIVNEMDLTAHMKTKLLKFLKIKKQPERKLSDQLQDIAGIGYKLSRDLIRAGVKSTADLKKKKYLDMLPEAAIVDIKFKPLKPIPRYMIEYLEAQMKKNRIPVVFVGSYRRHKPASSDVDLLMTIENLNRWGGAISFIKTLNEMNANIKFHKPFAIGPAKISTICRLVKYKVNLKVDIFITNKQEYPFALLYSTGSKEFNIKMRRLAQTKGYLLNQKGLFKGKKKIEGLTTERSIFEYLGMVYKLPKYRI